MAKIRDLLMGIAFFGKGYVNAKKRNDQAAAAKMYQALQMQEAQLRLEKLKAEEKRRVAEEKRLAKEREREQAKRTATEQIALSNGDPKDILRTRSAIDQGRYYTTPSGEVRSLEPGGLGPTYGGVRTARDPGKTFLEEAQPGKARLDVTDLSLRGKPTLPSAMQRLQAGKSIIPTTAERAFPGGTYQPPAMTSAMRGEFPALADRPALAERLTEPRMERPQLAETIREDLVAPVTTTGDGYRGGVSRTFDLPSTKEEEQNAIITEFPSVDEMVLADWVESYLKIPGLMKDSSLRLKKIQEAQNFADNQRKRSKNKKIQDVLDKDPVTRNIAESLLRLVVNPTSARDADMVYGVFRDLKRNGFNPEGDEGKNRLAYQQVVDDIENASLSSEDKRTRDIAKLKQDAQQKEADERERLQEIFDKFPRGLQAAAKSVISLHPTVNLKANDLWTEIDVAKLLQEKGWDINATLSSPKNKKIAVEVAEILDLSTAEEEAPEIILGDPLYDRISNSVMRLYPSKERFGIKKDIRTEFTIDPEYGKEALKVAINTSPEVTASERASIIGQGNAIAQLEQIRKLYQSFLKNGGSPNLYTRFSAGLLRTTGVGSIDRDLNEMLVRIENLYYDFRQNLTGAAFSQAEANQYRRLFPEISMKPERFFAGLDAVQNTYRDSMANFYKAYVGDKLYTDVFGAPKHKRVLTTTERAYVDATTDAGGNFTVFNLDNIIPELRTGVTELTEFNKKELPQFTPREREILQNLGNSLDPEEQKIYEKVQKDKNPPETYNLTDNQFKKLIEGFGKYLDNNKVKQ